MRIASLIVSSAASLACAGAFAADVGVDAVAWLAGCWQADPGEPGTVEQWLAPAGGTMLGVSRTVRQGRTVGFEFMQLRLLPDGTLAFIAQPSGRPPTVFRALSVRPGEAVFENPEHDFPKRIAYEKLADGSLKAVVDGGEGTEAYTFHYLPLPR